VGNSSVDARGKSAITGKDATVFPGYLTFAGYKDSIVETASFGNKFVFGKKSLQEVASKMEKWYGVSIRFPNEELKQQRFTCNFCWETKTEALSAVQ